ncbi:hypothetical protein L2E82_47368 [Cichorium intybus]|uniref:Uncharacterized protein n=1 Tax=Cichorium intybus TaxID=13427 RepID=A0ACB8YVV8_CICIN|nr:hypothetical protein L2E82_47368 [Cichorium intybus]
MDRGKIILLSLSNYYKSPETENHLVLGCSTAVEVRSILLRWRSAVPLLAASVVKWCDKADDTRLSQDVYVLIAYCQQNRKTRE